MARHDATNADVFIYSFKDGVLAKLAHDLKMKVERFSLNVDDASKKIEATFDATTVKVVARRKDGQDDPHGFNMIELGTINSNIEKDVLESKKFPEVRFVSTNVTQEGDGYRVQGDLTLHGKTRSIAATVRPQGNRWFTEVRLHQPDYGIKPYSAMMGALKVQADIIVSVSVPMS